jgi:hypothetical protein
MTKDQERIKSIIDKSNGSVDKEKLMTQQMANKITDAHKAMNRGEVAVKEFGKYEIGQIFIDRAIVLKPDLKDGNQYRNISYEIHKGLEARKNKKEYDDHIKNADSKLDREGIFYNIGIPVLHRQAENNKHVNAFNYALRRILQNLAGQTHVYVEAMSYSDVLKKLVVRCSPNFTYPKMEVKKAMKQYPILLADHLTKIYGAGVVRPAKDMSAIVFLKDIDFKKLVVSVFMTDVKHGELPKVAENKDLLKIKSLIKEQIKLIKEDSAGIIELTKPVTIKHEGKNIKFVKGDTFRHYRIGAGVDDYFVKQGVYYDSKLFPKGSYEICI